MDEHHHHLHLPLLLTPSPTTTTTGATTSGDGTDPSSNMGIGFRILLIISITLISTWANHEASKGFAITVTSNMEENTPLGKKFSLFYVSNDGATRLVQTASEFAARILYPDPNGMPDKLIDGVEIRLATHNLTHDHHHHIVEGEKNKYIMLISPQVMELSDFRHRIRMEIQRGMAEMFLLDLQNRAPKPVLDGMVEYVSNLAGFGPDKWVFKLRDLRGKCWEDNKPEVVAEFLGYCEGKSRGFIGRLNRAIRERNWDEQTLDVALGIGIPAKYLCSSFQSMMNKRQDLNSGLVSNFR